MAIRIVVTLDLAVTGDETYQKASPGKALAREIDRLDAAARRKEVAGITAMLSESHAVLIAQLKADGFDPANMRLPAERWFPAEEGLKTVQALHAHVSANLNDFKQPNPILRDLKAAETILIAGGSGGAKFHFTKLAE